MPNRPSPTSGRIYVPKSKTPKAPNTNAPSAPTPPSRTLAHEAAHMKGHVGDTADATSRPATTHPTPSNPFDRAALIAEFDERRHQARRVTELNAAKLAAHKELYALDEAASKDWRTADDFFEAGSQDIKRKFLESLSSAEARTEFERFFPELLIPRRESVRTKSVTAEVTAQHQTLTEAAAFYSDRTRNADNPFDREQAKRLMGTMIERAESAGLLSASDASGRIGEFNRGTSPSASVNASMNSPMDTKSGDEPTSPSDVELAPPATFEGQKSPSEYEPSKPQKVVRHDLLTADSAKELQYFVYDPLLLEQSDLGWKVEAVFDNRVPTGFENRVGKDVAFFRNERGFGAALVRKPGTNEYAVIIKGVEISEGQINDIAASGGAGAGQVNEAGPAIFEALRDKLKEIGKNGGSVIVVGHSLGGPEAQLLGVYLLSRAINEEVISDEEAYRAIRVRGFGGVGALRRVDALNGPNDSRLMVPDDLFERIDAINYLLPNDGASWLDEPYIGTPFVLEAPKNFEPDEWWADIPGLEEHTRSAYRAADYSKAVPDTRKRYGNEMPAPD
jgi:hypothetical protein